ncbi:MAG: MFS transporter [Dehalococcoidia bacterium]
MATDSAARVAARRGEDAGAPERGARLGAFAALAVRDYRVMWLGALAAFTAMQMQMIVQGFLAYKLTGSATVLGLVGLASGLPQLVLGLFGGVVADRVSKKRLLTVTQSSLGLVALATALLVASGRIQVWHLFVLGAVQGVIFSFNLPARQAWVPQLVGPHLLMNAIALNNTGMNFTRIFGPALAGVLIATPALGMEGVYFLIAGCYVLVVVSLLLIREPGAPVARERPSTPFADLKDGLHYVAGDPTLLVLIALAFVVTCLGMPYQTFLPVFAGPNVLDIGARGLGLMSTAVGAGALIGSLIVASLSNMRRRALVQLVMGAGFGLALVGLGLARTPLVALPVLMVVGLTANFFMSLNNTMLMSRSEPRFYGRVMSVYMLSWSAMPLASVPLGRLADAVGAPNTMLLAGALIAVIVVAVALLLPHYRRSETAAATPAVAGAGR